MTQKDGTDNARLLEPLLLRRSRLKNVAKITWTIAIWIFFTIFTDTTKVPIWNGFEWVCSICLNVRLYLITKLLFCTWSFDEKYHLCLFSYMFPVGLKFKDGTRLNYWFTSWVIIYTVEKNKNLLSLEKYFVKPLDTTIIW